MSLFEVALENFIDMNHEQVLLSNRIDWYLAKLEFAEYYCSANCRQSVPIRKMVGMLLMTVIKSYRNILSENANKRARLC